MYIIYSFDLLKKHTTYQDQIQLFYVWFQKLSWDSINEIKMDKTHSISCYLQNHEIIFFISNSKDWKDKNNHFFLPAILHSHVSLPHSLFSLSPDSPSLLTLNQSDESKILFSLHRCWFSSSRPNPYHWI